MFLFLFVYRHIMGVCNLCPSHVTFLLRCIDVTHAPFQQGEGSITGKTSKVLWDLPVANRSMYNFPSVITLCTVIDLINLQYWSDYYINTFDIFMRQCWSNWTILLIWLHACTKTKCLRAMFLIDHYSG